MSILVETIVDWLIRSNIILMEEREIYSFGVRQSIIYLINILTLVAVAAVFDVFWSLGIFYLVYIGLRPYAGGYHAETEIGCYLSSTVIVAAIAIILKQYHLNLQSTLLLLGVSSVIILMLGPVEDHHKPLDDMELKVYGKRMRWILLGELSIIVLALLMNNNLIMEATTVGITVVGLLVILGWIKNRLRVIGQ